jgi:hypothetical protein
MDSFQVEKKYLTLQSGFWKFEALFDDFRKKLFAMYMKTYWVNNLIFS